MMSLTDVDDEIGDTDQVELLGLAFEKAKKLLVQLILDREMLETIPPNIPVEVMVQGRQALDQAIAAARRTVAAIEMAVESN